MTNDNTTEVAGQGNLSDPELIHRVRSGDTAAYEALFLRHRDVAFRLARRLSDPGRADDIVAESFAKIFDLLQRGKGPDVAFRAYLLTTVRTVHLNLIRAGHRESVVADTELQLLTDPVDEDPDERFNEGAIARAFRQLPERWQSALWMTAVEGMPNEEISDQLGIQANAVASLAFRARAGLRRAYLAEHLLDAADADCRRVLDMLPSFLRATLTARHREVVEAHLERCSSCAVAAAELADVDRRLGALLAPLVVGGGAVAASLWPATAAAPAAPGTWAALAGIGQQTGAGIFAGVGAGATAAKVAVAASLAAAAIGVSTHSLLAGPETSRADHPTEVLGIPPTSAPTGAPTGTPAPSSVPTPVADAPPWVTVAGPLNDREPGPEPTSSVAPPTVPGGSPTTSPSTGPTSTPTTSPTASPSGAAGTSSARAIAMGSMTSEKVGHSGRSWHRVSIDVLEPVKDATVRVTSIKTMEAQLVLPATSGWICGTPRFTWLDSKFMASTTTDCVYNGRGDGSPIQIDYRMGDKGPVRGVLTPPAGCEDTSLLDNVADITIG